MNIKNIFSKNKKVEQRSLDDVYFGSNLGLQFNGNSSFTSGYAMRLSSVYRAVDLISDSMAMLPLEVQIIDQDNFKQKLVNHTTYSLLNKQPSPLMTRYTFIKLLVTSVMLNGNGFAYIKRDNKGNAIELQYLRPETVTINYNELTNVLSYYCAQVKGIIEPCNMIHLVKYSKNGVEGISVLANAANSLGLSWDTEVQARNFFKNGCNLSGLINSTTNLTAKQKQEIKDSWNSSMNGTGGGIPVLEGNLNYQSVSISSRDAQLLESRQFNLTDIARFFGLSPVLLGDLSHSSYSTIEATQLQFLSQTLQPWIELIEQEFSRKIFRPSENNLTINFDETKLIKTDKSALATYYQTLFNISAITPNEIRKELGLSAIDGGDQTYIQLNMSTLNNIDQEKNIDKIEK